MKLPKLLTHDKLQIEEKKKKVIFPYYTPTSKSDRTLIFESRFESGNLNIAAKVLDPEPLDSNNNLNNIKINKQKIDQYNLVLQNDINTKGHTQWFFFKVSNTFRGHTVKFNIINLSKPTSLYNKGMKVLIYSKEKVSTHGVGWFRGCKDISYYKNKFRRETSKAGNWHHYTLTFTHTFEFNNDEVYFAHSLPYTYSDLKTYIDKLQKKHETEMYLTINTLCRTIAGNKCEYLTITSKAEPEEISKRKGIFLTARVHPGETGSSWMMQGVIDFLTSDNVEAKILRDNFVFKIIPMLNPDGVIHGNYRCSLAGCDLNRRWKFPSPIIHPSVYYAK